MEQQQVAMFGPASWIPVHPATTTLTAAAPITDTGIRLKPRGRFALYSCMDVEALGMICPGCSGLVCLLKPFGRCEACGEFTFEVDPEVERPKTIYPGRASGTATQKGGIAAVRVTPAHTATTAEEVVKHQREKSEDADSVTTVSQRPPPKKRTSVVAPTSGGGGPSRMLTPDPEGSVDGSSGRPRKGQGKPAEKTWCEGGGVEKAWPSKSPECGCSVSTQGYIPAEECDTSDLESLSDTGDDALIDDLFAKKGWDKIPLASFRGSGNSPMSIGESTPRVEASAPEGESLPQLVPASPAPSVSDAGVKRLLLRPPMPRMEVVKAPRHPDSVVLPGEGDKAIMPPLARLQRLFSQKVAAEYGWEYPYLSKDLLYEVEVYRERWYNDFVWTHLKVPHARRYLTCSPKASQRFKDCKAEWMVGRHIHADKVVIRRKEGEDVEYHLETMDQHLKPLILPHPRFYL